MGITWVQDGPVETGVDECGDDQVGKAMSVRFRSDECPSARFDVIIFGVALETDDDGRPKPGSIDLRAEYRWYRNGAMVDGRYEGDGYERISYDCVGSDIGYAGSDGIFGEMVRAGKHMRQLIRKWTEGVNDMLDWDGVSEPKG